MNISVIGSTGLAGKLAKKGTTSDIALYNTSYQGKYFTFVEPVTYPDKVQTLFQTINMSQFSVIYFNSETPKNVIGECIIAINTLRKPGMFVLDSFDKEALKHLLKGTFLETFPVVSADSSEIMPVLLEFNLPPVEGKTKVIVDHAFNVKSVGTIALGTVISGEIKKHDNMTIYPIGKQISIKSIQIHDKEYDKASCFDRVGLSIKGAEVDDITRGSVISNSIKCIREISVNFLKNRFFNEDIPKNVMCVFGLQYANASMDNGKLVFSRPVAYYGEEIIILAPEKKVRMAGIASCA